MARQDDIVMASLHKERKKRKEKKEKNKMALFRAATFS
jgi:hypothetical protein